MRAATTLSALALLAWLTRRPRPAVVAFLDRLLHALALLGLRVSTAAGLLAHRVLHACHVYWTQRRARVGDISDASGDSDGCKAPALIPRNTSIHIVRGSSQRAAPPRAVGQGTPVLPPVGGCQQRLPREVVALGPVPDGCVVERIPFASALTTASGAVDDGQGGVGGGGAAPALSFSFQGCAWMMHYHFGAARLLHDKVGVEWLRRCHFLGASSGSLVAMALAVEIDLDEMGPFLDQCSREVTTRFGGPLGIMTQIVRGSLSKLLRPNSYQLANGRLFVSISEPSPLLLRNRLVSHWSSNEELLDTLLASCYIPIYYEVPATVGGRVTLDGGLTNNLPLHPVHPDTTVRVSPRWDCGEATVKPSRPYPAWFSLFPSSVQDLETVGHDGYTDMGAFVFEQGGLQRLQASEDTGSHAAV